MIGRGTAVFVRRLKINGLAKGLKGEVIGHENGKNVVDYGNGFAGYFEDAALEVHMHCLDLSCESCNPPRLCDQCGERDYRYDGETHECRSCGWVDPDDRDEEEDICQQ